VDQYKGLKAKDRRWLEKFEKAYTGRASVAECDELGVPPAMRREFYNARYARRRRLDAFLRSSATGDIQNRVKADPTEHIEEIIELRRTTAVKLPLHKDEGVKAPSPAKLSRRG